MDGEDILFENMTPGSFDLNKFEFFFVNQGLHDLRGKVVVIFKVISVD